MTRMLLSCLVDADRLDTAEREAVQAPLDAANRLETLLAHIDSLSAGKSEGTVKRARAEVLENCRGEDHLEPGLPSRGDHVGAQMRR